MQFNMSSFRVIKILKNKKRSSKTPCRTENVLVDVTSQEPFVFVDTELD